MVTIKKEINGIWLGSVLDEVGRKNLGDWKASNSDYTVNLWIDSSLYTDKDNADYERLRRWAVENKIDICDVNPKQKELSDTTAPVRNRSDIYNNMLSKDYYLDEINGNYKNLAAASDILRVEILYRQGGIYFDVKDVFPNKPIETLNTTYGFCCHINESHFINNDVLASVPHGTVISAYRQLIHDRYDALYQNDGELRAHRNVQFTNPSLYGGSDPRKASTLRTSGPQALDDTLLELETVKAVIPEAKLTTSIDFEKKITFNPQLFSLPPKQAASWYESKATFDVTVPTLRNYIREYFNSTIDKQIKLIEHQLKECKEGKDFLLHGNKSTKIQAMGDILSTLNKIKMRLNALPTSLSMKEVYQNCISNLDEKVIKSINVTCDKVISKLEKCSNTLESLISDIQKHAKSDELQDMLMNIGVKSYSKYKLNEFVENVLLNTEGGKPNLEKLKAYGLELSTDEKSIPPSPSPL